MNITRVGVDIAKTVFHVHAVDRHERTQWQAKLTRGRWIESLCEHVDRGAEIGIEDAENGLTEEFRILLADLAEDLRHLDKRISGLDERIAQCVKSDPVARRLLEFRGVGPLTASALASALGDGKGFTKGLDFAASL